MKMNLAEAKTKLAELTARLVEADDLQAAAALLGWDQSTYMPPAGATARGRQLATLQRLAHEKFTDPAVGRLLDELQPYADSLPEDHDDAALIRVTRRKYDLVVRVPPTFTATLATQIAESYAAWVDARPANNYAAVLPYLEKTLALSRQLANYFPGYEHIADPLINFSDYGMTVKTLRPLLTALRAELTQLIQQIERHAAVDDSCIYQFFPEKMQWEFGEKVIRTIGYDFERGRQDKTHHPFMTKFSLDDIRITTRIKEHNFGEGFFSTLHEAGHALYEQGINRLYEGTPLADGTSAGVHESQSRLWENLVGRSHAFWQHYYPQLQAVFPTQLGKISYETFYKAVNKVQPSLIRTDADEVTYNLHVIIRFELELALLEGTLEIKDLPEAWHERYATDLGITPPDDRDGVLQDVHWYSGLIGGVFQGYTLGNILASQFFAAAQRAHPQILDEIANGHFCTLHEWLRKNIYQHGSKFTTVELVERSTGEPLTLTPYLNYLHTKYGQIYRL